MFRNSIIGRQRLIWIIVGISIVFVIALVIIPTTIVLKKKNNLKTTTTIAMEITQTTAKVASTTKKGVYK